MTDVLAANAASPLASTRPASAPLVSAPLVSAPSGAASPPAAAPHGASFFHTLLADLNPLQYIPVVGTIYRAVTGDEGNPTLRFVASLGTSFALGGPIGVAITTGEEIIGIHPERMALNFARHLFHLGHDEAAPSATAPPVAAPASADPLSNDAEALAFNVAGHGMDADALNGLELQRLNDAGQMA